MSRPFDSLKAQLECRGFKVRDAGARGGAVRTARSQCPSHNSKGLTLAIGETTNGLALIHCHAGCSTEEVLAVLGLDPTDLFPPGGALRRLESSPLGVTWQGLAGAADALRDACSIKAGAVVDSQRLHQIMTAAASVAAQAHAAIQMQARSLRAGGSA